MIALFLFILFFDIFFFKRNVPFQSFQHNFVPSTLMNIILVSIPMFSVTSNRMGTFYNLHALFLIISPDVFKKCAFLTVQQNFVSSTLRNIILVSIPMFSGTSDRMVSF